MTDLDSYAENRWTRFGLATNPYFVQPLNSSDDGPRPISLFKGRASEGKGLASSIASEETSLNVVEAPSGVGKSTFVNYVKFRLRDRYFAPPLEVGVQSDWNATAVLLAVLDVLVKHASDLNPDAKWPRDFPAIARARELVTSIQHSGWGVSFGLQPATPIGASVGLSRQTTGQRPLIGPVLSPAFFADLVQDLLSMSTPPKDGVILHVNNLDTLMAASVRQTRTLISDLRDYFQVTNLHWILVGPPGLQADALAPERRVMSVVKEAIQLDKLPPADLEAFLQSRYEHYALPHATPTEPTDPKLVREIYSLFGGDLRGTLNALTRAHRYFDPVDVAPLRRLDGLEILAGHFRAHLLQALAAKPQRVLDHLTKLGAEEFTQDDAKPIEKFQSARSKHFSDLEQWDAIRLVRTEGPRKFYTLGGAARLASLTVSPRNHD